MYAKNATRGQWKAHGRYIARESASQGRAVEAGFDATARKINIAARLDQWQSAGDERMWKLIVSPEFGDKMDLVELTRGLMQRMTRDLDTQLEWVAVSHFNTDNPHVHIALRGVREDGNSLRLERDYVKHGIRGMPRIYVRGSSGIAHNEISPKPNVARYRSRGSRRWTGPLLGTSQQMANPRISRSAGIRSCGTGA